ncbi:MAG: alkane 1-monooxygenase [Chitinophagales bacterium]
MNVLKYLCVFSIPLVGCLSLALGGWWSYSLIIYSYFLIPLIELAFGGTTQNMDKATEEIMKTDRIYDYLIYACVPVQYAFLAYFLHLVSTQSLATYELIGYIVTMGIMCGVVGINVAHELGHRNKKSEQTMSKALLLTSLYMHFFIEHNRGHHKNVSTEIDPATSRYGEILYVFWFRSVIFGYLSAWKLERERLQKVAKSFFSLHNEMLVFQLIQIAFVAGIFAIFGASTMFYFLIAAVIGFLHLETVNYIEHYGLRRKKIGDNIYERVLPVHSWNSNHPLGRMMLFELTRHSDHHFRPNRKYQTLRHFDNSLQMPTGYPGMMVLSFFPPLWFFVMHRRIEMYRNNHELGKALA